MLVGEKKWAGKLGAGSCGKLNNCATAASSKVGWVCERLRAGVAGDGCEPDAGWAQQLICLQSQSAHLDAADDVTVAEILCVHTSRRLNRMANAVFTAVNIAGFGRRSKVTFATSTGHESEHGS